MISFIGTAREQVSFMPYDLNEWLPEDHLARFVVDIVPKIRSQLDLQIKRVAKG